MALSGSGQDADRARTKAAGFHHHLVKPVDLEVLKEVLEAAPGLRPAPRLPESVGDP